MARRVAICAVAFGCAVLFILQFCGWPRPFTLIFDVQTERCARIELVYDTRPGTAAPQWVMRMVDSPGRFTPVRLPIRSSNPSNLRLFQAAGGHPVRVRRVRLQRFGGKILQVPNAQLSAADPATTVTHNGDSVEVNGTGNDAVLRISPGRPLRESPLVFCVRWILVAALTAALVTLLTLLKRAPHLSVLSERGDRLLGSIFVVGLVVLFASATLFELNGSSTPLWRYFADLSAPNAGVLLGNPKEIRSDEYQAQTPWIMSQVARGFPTSNPNVGEGEMVLLNNLPARHWSMFFRPQMWAFFVADLEHAFAWYWNFKWFALLLGAFLFLRFVGKGAALPAALVALMLHFSAFIQWWFSTPTAMPEMVGAVFFGLWSIAVIRGTRSKAALAGAVVLLIASIQQFVFCSYPRFQLPLLYFAVFVLLSGCTRPRGASLVWMRIVALLVAALCSAALLVSWFQQVGPMIRRIAAQAYPGAILSVGGGIPWAVFFAPFLEFSMTQEHVRAGAMNVCGASGFLFFVPLVAATALQTVFQKKPDRLVIAMTLYALLLIAFMHYGVPAVVAKWTGFSRVSPLMANLALAVTTFVALARHIGPVGADSQRNTPIAWMLLLFVGSVAVLYATNVAIGRFVDLAGVIAAGVLGATVYMCLWKRWAVAAALLVLPSLIYSNGLANPVVHGLSGITGSELFGWCAQVEKNAPGGKWIVLGTSRRSASTAHLIKATGADVLGGTRCDADRAMVRALDPSGRYADVYNRLAWFTFAPSPAAEPAFELSFVNRYAALLPMKPEIFDALGVRHVVEVDLPEPEGRIAGFRVLGEREGCRLLEREHVSRP